VQPLVLCYHAVSPTWPASFALPAAAIADHLSLLRRRGYVGLTVTEAERRRADGALPRRAVVVTFDDGFASTLAAKPALDACGFPATVFVVSSFPGSGERLRWPGVDHWLDGPYAHELTALGWDELERLADAGWEIGSHTVSHPRLPELDDATLERELRDSRREIEARIGACRSIAYPYGLADTRVAAAAARAGYVTGLTLTSLHVRDEPLLRPRTGLYLGDTGTRARLKLSPWFGALRRSRAAPLLQAFTRD